jgi:hypothetical protein
MPASGARAATLPSTRASEAAGTVPSRWRAPGGSAARPAPVPQVVQRTASASAVCAAGGVAQTGYNAFREPTPDSMTAADDRGSGHATVHRPGGLDGPLVTEQAKTPRTSRMGVFCQPSRKNALHRAYLQERSREQAP